MRKCRKTENENSLKKQLHWYLIHTWSDKDFNGTVVNRALPSLNGGGSLEIKNPRVTFENFTYETPLVNDLQFILFNLIILQQFLGENRIQIRPKPHEKFMLVFLFIKLAYNKSNKILDKDLSELETFNYKSSYEKSIKLHTRNWRLWYHFDIFHYFSGC